MYLEKLEINGFKSFAHSTSLDFNQGIAAIVGPNGSGKSNVAEAVRWVMGEQSMKSLRGKQSTDVIFSGSDKSARLGAAEVVLVFNNQDRRVDLDYTEISFTRRVHRDGRSEYYVNNQPVRLQDVLLLLAQINLSSKTYSVIGQGMVDEILSASASSRKDFFEEASGVKPLQLKKNEALRKLGRTLENLQTVSIQLGEIEPRLRSLTRQLKKLEKRTALENRLRDLQYVFYGKSLYNHQDKLMQLRAQEDIKTKEVVKLESEVKSLQNIMYSLTKNSSHSDKFALSQKKYQELFDKKSTLREQELKVKEEILKQARKNEDAGVPISLVRELESRFQQLHKLITLHRDKAAGNKNLEDWLSWHGVFDQIVNAHADLLKPFKPYLQAQDKSNQAQELLKIQQALAELTTEFEQNQLEIRNLAELEKKEKVKIWQTQNDLQVHQKQLNQLVNQRNDLRVELARINAHLGDLESEIINENGDGFLERLRNWRPGQDDKLHDTQQLTIDIHKLKHELELVGGIDPEVQQEHLEIKERYDFLATQSKDLESGVSQLKSVVADLDETIKRQFSRSFQRINNEFKKYFKLLFRGGKAELKLLMGMKEISDEEATKKDVKSDRLDETDLATGAKFAVNSASDQPSQGVLNEICGVDIVATPPGKKITTIEMLSGGERALTSIALISAIISNNPAPFVVLDEVDAALDEENSLRFAEIVTELSGHTQFIIITHNRSTMEQASLLYGVTMGDDGISKLVSLKLNEAEIYTNR